MKHLRVVLGMLAAVLVGGCGERDEVSVDETRPLASNDFAPRLNAGSDERFGNAQPCPFTAETPKDWQRVPADQFRLMNYRFGPSGEGAAWVSTSGGSVLENANRWLRQFGAPELDEAGLKALPTVPLLGATAVVVKAEGTYQAGSGQPEKTGYGLAGAIAAYEGGVITVKMVAPAGEVRFGFPALLEFIGGLRKID
jgi:hypothetical protein